MNPGAIRPWVIFLVAIILIIAGVKGRLGSVIGALIVPGSMQEGG